MGKGERGEEEREQEKNECVDDDAVSQSVLLEGQEVGAMRERGREKERERKRERGRERERRERERIAGERAVV